MNDHSKGVARNVYDNFNKTILHDYIRRIIAIFGPIAIDVSPFYEIQISSSPARQQMVVLAIFLKANILLPSRHGAPEKVVIQKLLAAETIYFGSSLPTSTTYTMYFQIPCIICMAYTYRSTLLGYPSISLLRKSIRHKLDLTNAGSK